MLNFHFYIFTKLYTCGPLWRNFLLYIYTLIHDKLFLCTHWNSLSLHHTVKPYLHSKIFFVFLQRTPMVHTNVSLYTLVVHTHKNFSTRIFYKNPSMHIFLFLYIRRHFIHYTSLFFLSWFWFILFLGWRS